MIRGIVSGHNVLVPINFPGLDGQQYEIEGMLDTGFTGFLTMPAALITRFGFRFLYPLSAKLADGSEIEIEVYQAMTFLDGAEINAEVLMMGDEVLLGMSLLDGYDIHIQSAEGGLVTIEML